MNQSKIKTVASLNGFIAWVKKLPEGEYLFRGLSKETYEIEASTMRRLPKKEQTLDNLRKLNKDLIKDARTQGHDRKDGEKLSDLELLAELQHNKAATCLIDFTKNALVALWFACKSSAGEEQRKGRMVAVRSDNIGINRFREVTHDLLTRERIDYFFQAEDGGKSQPTSKMIGSKKRTVLASYVPRVKHYPLYKWQPRHSQNHRIAAQHSVFIFGGQQVTAEHTCIILRGAKEKILKELDAILNINEATMFPDFEGFANLYGHDKLYIEPDAEKYLKQATEAFQRGDFNEVINYSDKGIKNGN